MTREIFKVSEVAPDPGRVFYTITAEDVNKTHISTSVGKIPVGEVMGRVLKVDVGKRLYRVPNNARDSWFWQVENDRQLRERLARGRMADGPRSGPDGAGGHP
jgi:hypothetical protein